MLHLRARVVLRSVTVEKEIKVAHISDVTEPFSLSNNGALNPVERGAMAFTPSAGAQVVCIAILHDQRSMSQKGVLSDTSGDEHMPPSQREAERLVSFIVDAMTQQTVYVTDERGNESFPPIPNMYQSGDTMQAPARVFVERVAVFGENGEDLPPDTRVWVVGCQEHRVVSSLVKTSIMRAAAARRSGPAPDWRNPACVNHVSVLMRALRTYLADLFQPGNPDDPDGPDTLDTPDTLDELLYKARSALVLREHEQMHVGTDPQLTYLLGPKLAGRMSRRRARLETGRRFVAHTQREPEDYVQDRDGAAWLAFPPGTTYEVVGGEPLERLRKAPFPYAVTHFSTSLDYVSELRHAASAVDPQRVARAAIYAAIMGGDIPDYDRLPVRRSSLYQQVVSERKAKTYEMDSFEELADRAASLFPEIDNVSENIEQRAIALNLAQAGMWSAYDQCFGHLIDVAPESMRCSGAERARLVAVYDVLRAPRVLGESLCPPDLQRRVCTPDMSPLSDMLVGCMNDLESIGATTNHVTIEYMRTALMYWPARTHLRVQLAMAGAASGGKSWACMHLTDSIIGAETATHQTTRVATAEGNYNSTVQIIEEANSQQIGIAQVGELQTGDPVTKALATQTTGVTQSLLMDKETGKRTVSESLSLRKIATVMCTNEPLNRLAVAMRERLDILYVALAQRPHHGPIAHIDSERRASPEYQRITRRNQLEEAFVWYIQRLESLGLLLVNMLAYKVHSRRIMGILAPHADVKSVRNNGPVRQNAKVLTIRQALHLYLFSELAISVGAPPTDRATADRAFAAQIAPLLVCTEEIVYAAFAMGGHKYVNPLVKPVARALARIAAYSATTDDNAPRAPQGLAPGGMAGGMAGGMPPGAPGGAPAVPVRMPQGETYVETHNDAGRTVDYNYVVVGTELRDVARAAEADMADALVRYVANDIMSMLHAWQIAQTYKCVARVGPRTEGAGEPEARPIVMVCPTTKRVSVLAAYLDSIYRMAEDDDVIASALCANMSQLTRRVDTVRAMPVKHAPHMLGRLMQQPRADGDATIRLFVPYGSDEPAPPGAGDWARIRAQMNAKTSEFRECVDDVAFRWHMLSLGCMAPQAYAHLRPDAVARRFSAMALAAGPPDPAAPADAAHGEPGPRARAIIGWLNEGGAPTPRYPYANIAKYMGTVLTASIIASGRAQLPASDNAHLRGMLHTALDEAGLNMMRVHGRVSGAQDAEWRNAIAHVHEPIQAMVIMSAQETDALTNAYLQIGKFGDMLGIMRSDPLQAREPSVPPTPHFRATVRPAPGERFIPQMTRPQKRTATDAELDGDESDAPSRKRGAPSATPVSAPDCASPRLSQAPADKLASARANMRAPAPVPARAAWVLNGAYEMD